jgi:hypothetical protein
MPAGLMPVKSLHDNAKNYSMAFGWSRLAPVVEPSHPESGKDVEVAIPLPFGKGR